MRDHFALSIKNVMGGRVAQKLFLDPKITLLKFHSSNSTAISPNFS